MKTPSERLVAALAELGVTQQDLSERLGVGRSAVSHWTNARRSIDVDLAKKIAEALGIRASWLAFGDGPMTADQAPAPPPTTKKRRPKSRASKPGVRRAVAAPPTTEFRAAS